MSATRERKGGHPLPVCGTPNARTRHRRRKETCETCDNTRKRQPTTGTPQPCGTPAAYRRHKTHGQEPCEPCTQAYRAQQAERRRGAGTPPRDNITDIIEDIEHLLNAGEGEARILQAINYTGRAGSLQQRLRRNGRLDLYTRICTPWELAA